MRQDKTKLLVMRRVTSCAQMDNFADEGRGFTTQALKRQKIYKSGYNNKC